MRVVIAPDKFKGCLTAAEVTDSVAGGLRAVRPDVEIRRAPVADGGDGTVAAALSAGFTLRTVRVAGPTGEPVEAPYAVAGHRAIVELAAVVGLDRLPDGRLDPMSASTYGLGQVIADAVAGGATEIVLGLGGSASTDGGVGLVQALGAWVTDDDGRDIGRGGGALATVAAVDLNGLRKRMRRVRVIVASDVDNPLLGPDGAAAVFGPQKGATAHDVTVLERGLQKWAGVVARATGADWASARGTGAAGGTGFAAVALLDAQLRPGIELILELLDFDRTVTGADLVITGEGSLDEQSLSGKAPFGVARAAGRAGVPVVAVAGRSLLAPADLHRAGVAAAYPLSDLEPNAGRSIAQAASLLAIVGRRIATEWLR